MPHLYFTFAVTIRPTVDQRFHVTCRDLPELDLISDSAGLLDTLREVEEGLDRVVQSYLEREQKLPRPSLRESGEHIVAPSPQTIAAAILLLGSPSGSSSS